ncbi:MAG TPA: mycofactocin biosynthesis glycosyltransferase MftF [Acidimicrobiales bacterium]
MGDSAVAREALVSITGAPQGASLEGALLRADRTLEWLSGTLVSGGSPWRLFRLSDDGARLLGAWTDGERVQGDAASCSLARRFVDAGLLHPTFAPRAPSAGDVDVVIPVRDDADRLRRVLSVLSSRRAPRVTVVDDGSVDGEAVAAVAAEHDATLIRRETPGGPGAARNTGFASTTAPFVAFIDADALPESEWLDLLLSHFDDPAVAAVAPRVRGPAGAGARERFEAAASPLDLGPHPGVVRPGAAVAFVPGAALVLRRAAVVVPFDESLGVGEDVDLVWRLCEQGWLVRYEPDVVVTHAARSTWHAWIAQRFSYGLSAAPLEARHGDAAAPLRADPRVLGTLALVLAGRPRAALGLLSWSATSLATQLDGIATRGGSDAAARQIAARGTALAAPGLARSAFRTYGPVLIAGAVVLSPLRRPVIVLTTAATAVRWWRAGRPRDPITFAAMSLADDLAYGAGVLTGSVRARRLGALRPRLRPATSTASISRT